ncbi:MAG: NTP transferase domain-containing protein [Candidatus Bathyarchaeota archaeon]|nr:NTP transferase domain-containing protein [Candidatus Bathyarchaeota archaeon]
MTTTALVMAGGKGTRMALAEEKPMLQVGGKPVVSLVLEALKNAKKVDSVVVAVSSYTPKTAAYLDGFPVKVLKTPGKEYVSDMGYAVKALNMQTVLAIAADMPLITGEIIDAVLDEYASCGKPALVVAVPLKTKRKLGMSLGYAFDFDNEQVVPAGININDGRRIDEEELEQDVYVLDKVEVAVNINTVDELKRAKELFSQLRKPSEL